MRSREPHVGFDRTVVRGDPRVTPDPDSRRTPESMRPAPPQAVVIKIGGRSLEAPGAPEQFAAEVASFTGPMLLVHGGGREVSDWCERLSLPPHFVNGLRVTDRETLEVAVAVLAGLANTRLVAQLCTAGVDAVGLSGVDGGVLEVERHPDHALLGEVGRVRGVGSALLEVLLSHHRTPVLSSIGADRGRLLNLNADEVAGALAGALAARTLVLLSDAPGVVLDGQRVPTLRPGDLEAALHHADVQDGMVPKLAAARRAIAEGVTRVRIASWAGAGTLARLLDPDGPGTTVLASDPEARTERKAAVHPHPSSTTVETVHG